MTSQSKICPHCGNINTPWRQFCKICRQSLAGAQPYSPHANAYIDETLKIYFSEDKHALLTLSSLHVEYQKKLLHILTPWENVKSLSKGLFGPYLLLWESDFKTDEVLSRVFSDFDGRHIPLAPFGYPENTELFNDLRAFAPFLFR